jgi:D-alanyl-D-alanine carboxypeptidase/D-alanyl-D-alanine-endopeptidase (penicillin-binding protein 4)
VQAKSGTITRVLCYVGYAQGPNSDIAFAIMLNRYTGKFKDTKKAVEQALILLTK